MEVLTTPVKSESDKKEYRLMKLENGMKVLLISKPDASVGKSLAAACLTVFVGSYDNPPNVEGLAHFFEHMIFLDKGKYEKSFKEFIEGYNGYSNAMTGNHFTSYEFSVNDEKFSESITRFAAMFQSATLDRNLMINERHNVDSEFRIKKQNSAIRRAHIHRLYLNQSHHASRFPTGNLKTLKDDISEDDLHKELTKFNENYVANKMALCVQSSKTLDEMQAIVIENFSVLKRNDLLTFNHELQVDLNSLARPEFYSKILYIKDLNVSTMGLFWLLPSASQYYKTKPLDILSRIFQNNDPGGLIPFLKDQNLITDLKLGHKSWLSSTQFSCLGLEMELTDDGFERIEDILSAIFSYLLMIKETPIDNFRRLFNDISDDLNQRFKFLPESSASSNVDVCKNMDILKNEDLLRAEQVLLDFDEATFMDYINRLNEGKFNITFMTKKRSQFPLHEEIYEIEYDEVDLPEKYKELWNERQINEKFFLEKPNPYKVNNFEIYTDDEELDHPEKIYKNEIIEIWHMLDRTYKQPIVKIEMILFLKNFAKTAELFSYMQLFQQIVSEIFNRKFSKSQKAGFSNDMYSSFDYIEISFDGYNDKMLMIIEETFGEFKRIINNVDEIMFSMKCEEFKKNLKENMQNPQVLCSEQMKKLLSNNYFTSGEIVEALDTINFENFFNSIKEAFRQIKAVTLVQGNMRKHEAMKIAELFQRYFGCTKLDEENRVVARAFQVPKGSHTLRINSLHPTDDLSVITNYYQVSPYTVRVQNLASMLESFLNPKAFDFLRTKQQLSYVVSFRMMKFEKVVGFTLTVRSNEKTNDFKKVYSKMEEFINILCRQYITDLTDSEFIDLKQGRIAGLSEPLQTISSEFQRNFREIREEAYNFDRTSEAIEDAKRIEKSDLQQFFISVFASQSLRKLMIHVIGNNSDVRETSEGRIKTEIDEIMIYKTADFQKNLIFYPVNCN